MAYGFELKDATGKVTMSTEDFGLQIVDDFTVSSGSSGSKAFPELAYHNKVFATTMSNITGVVTAISVAGHSFMEISVVVDGSNIPTISWTTVNASGAKLVTGIFESGIDPTEQDKPDTRIIILAG